jgi:plastocyanin
VNKIGVLLFLGVGVLPHPGERGPRSHLVEIQGMTFRPAVLEVERGDTVIWVNRDMVPHSASGTGKPAWSTGTLTQDQRGHYVPKASGTIQYFCELHPVMKGTLIVR